LKNSRKPAEQAASPRLWPKKETKHIHRKVKCAHLVPEPDSRWHSHVVLGSKIEKQPKTNRKDHQSPGVAQKETQHIHCKVKCAHLVLEPDSR